VNDEVNGFISRFWGAFLMPADVARHAGLFLLIPSVDPMKANIAKFRGVFNGFIAVMMIFLFYIYFLTMLWNLGVQSFKMSAALLPATGLILFFAGLMMRHAKRNFFIGIRTPWTVSNDRVWDQTHRVGSVLFMISGLLAFAVGFFPGPIAFLLMFFPIAGSSTILVMYSYILYQQETKA